MMKQIGSYYNIAGRTGNICLLARVDARSQTPTAAPVVSGG
jgi:hypothetical protein